ncbi:MAG TPA: DUF4157 domain-containing protein [Polyangia bacterium]|nr:DUF4157 domain-containing protein [Polyangia bacterium]
MPRIDRLHARIALFQALGGQYTNAGPRALALCERVFGSDTMYFPSERGLVERKEPPSPDPLAPSHPIDREPTPEPHEEPEVAAFEQARTQTLCELLKRLISQLPAPPASEILTVLDAAESHVAKAALSRLNGALLPGEGRYGKTYYQALTQAAGENVSDHLTGRRERIERMLPGWPRAGRLGNPPPPPLETRLLRHGGRLGAGQLLGSWDKSATPEARAQRHAETEERLAEDHPALAILGQGGGEPLPEAVLGRMNRLLGHDFSHVCIHTDGAAAQAAEVLGARALALGTHIYFGAGQYAPGTPAGDRLLVHELMHVVQHDRGHLVQPSGERFLTSHPDDATEREARSAEHLAALSGEPGGVPSRQDQRPVAEPTSLPPVAHAPTPRAALILRDDLKKGGKTAKEPTLPDGVNYQVLADGTFIARTSWLLQGVEDGAKIHAPDRIVEVLRALRSAHVLYWLDDDAIAFAKDRLIFEGGPIRDRKFVHYHIAAGAYQVLGLPPQVDLNWLHSDGVFRLFLNPSLVGSGGAGAPLGASDVPQQVSLRRAVTEKVWAALERFVGFPMKPGARTKLSAQALEITVSPGDRALSRTFTAGELGDYFDPAKWAAYLRNPSTGDGGGSILEGGVRFAADVPEADRRYFLDWMKQLGGGSGGGGQTLVSRSLIERLRRIDAHPRRQEILDLLRSGGAGSKGLSTTFLDNVIHQVETAAAMRAVGWTPPAPGPDGRRPIFEEPVRGTIVSRSGLLYPGREAEFYFETQNKMDAWAVPWVAVRWLAHPQGEPQRHLATGTTGHVEYQTPDTFDVTFEKVGIYVMHAFVQHSYYLPSHFEMPVEVKAENDRMREVERQAFTGLDGPSRSEQHDFDTSWSNELLGPKRFDTGVITYGELPPEFQRLSYEDRVQFLSNDRNNLQTLIEQYKDSAEPRYQNLVRYARDRLRSLAEAEKALGQERKQGSTFFEARAAFLSRANGIPDKPLRLVASAKKDGVVVVKIHDYTQLYEPTDYTFSASGKDFDAALEATFVDLCKSYPPGRVSARFERLNADATLPLGKTIGFELDTGTAWKSIKSVVFAPAVQITVNLVGAAVMIFLPVTAPVLFPVLAAYNSVATIDEMTEKYEKGLLDRSEVAKGVAQIGLNFLPYVGEMKVVANFGKTAMYALEGVMIAGQAVLMTAQGVQMVRQLRDRDVSQIAQLNARITELERVNPSHPDLGPLRRERDQLIVAAQNRATEVFQDMAAQGAILLLPPLAFNRASKALTKTKITHLTEEGVFRQRPGQQPSYDPATGTIHGDPNTLTAAELDKLLRTRNTDLAARQADLGKLLGSDRVTVKTGGKGEQVRIRRGDDGSYTVEIPAGHTWRDAYEQARQVRGGGPEVVAEPTAGRKGEIRPTFSGAELATTENVAVGNGLATLTEGHDVLHQLSQGHRSAFRRLGVEPPPAEFDPRLVEWGLGQLPDGSFIVIRGQPGAVDWSGFPGVKAIAHTHPFTPQRRLVGGTGGAIKFTDIIGGGGPQQKNQVHLFPSAADVAFCVRNGLNEHTVKTPYISKGNGLVGNPTPGRNEPTIDFHILQPERVGSWLGNEEVGVYRSRMQAVAGDQVLWSGDVYSVHHPSIGSLLFFEEPPGIAARPTAGLKPTSEPGGTRSTGDSTPAGNKAFVPSNERQEKALADWEQLKASNEPYEGKKSFDEWVEMYDEGWEFDQKQRRWTKPDANRAEPKQYAPNATVYAVWNELVGAQSKSTFKSYAEMLVRRKIATKEDIREQIQAINPAGKYEDVVRHRLKQHYREQVLEQMVHPSPDAMAAKYKDLPWDRPDEAMAVARQREMMEITQGLEPADKGNLVEDWYQRIFAPEARQHVMVKKEAVQGQVELASDRVIDLVDGTTMNEVKTVSDKLSQREEAQFKDYMKMLDAQITVTVDGKPRQLKRLKYVFTTAEGAKANVKFIRDALELGEGRVSIEVFDPQGHRHVLRGTADLEAPPLSWL